MKKRHLYIGILFVLAIIAGFLLFKSGLQKSFTPTKISDLLQINYFNLQDKKGMCSDDIFPGKTGKVYIEGVFYSAEALSKNQVIYKGDRIIVIKVSFIDNDSNKIDRLYVRKIST